MAEKKIVEFGRTQLPDEEHVWKYLLHEDGSLSLHKFVYTPSEKEFGHSGIMPKQQKISIPNEYVSRILEILQG